jgi:hypothetical protein
MSLTDASNAYILGARISVRIFLNPYRALDYDRITRRFLRLSETLAATKIEAHRFLVPVPIG